jgi:hypothetical protein
MEEQRARQEAEATPVASAVTDGGAVETAAVGGGTIYGQSISKGPELVISGIEIHQHKKCVM